MTPAAFQEALKKNRTKLSKSIQLIALEVKSKEAALLLRSESGLHSYEFEEDKYHRSHVTVHSEPLKELEFPLHETPSTLSLKNIVIRREYTIPSKYHDTFLSERGQGGFSQTLLDQLLRTTLLREAYSMLD